jgi:hypothetical protein
MTQEEINEYASRVEAMAKKEPAYLGWGFFYHREVKNIRQKNVDTYADMVLQMAKTSKSAY